jgi:hypothetical protein
MVGFPIIILIKIAWALVKIPLANFVGSMLGGGSMYDTANQFFGVRSTQPYDSTRTSTLQPSQDKYWEASISHTVIQHALRGKNRAVYSNARLMGYVVGNRLYDNHNRYVGRIENYESHLALFNGSNSFVGIVKLTAEPKNTFHSARISAGSEALTSHLSI